MSWSPPWPTPAGRRRLGVTHWSARLLGAELGISFASVARIWRKWGLQLWRAETFKFSTDPELDAKIRDVVGLYLNPSCFAVFVDHVPAAAQAARTARVSCGVACSGHGLRNLAAMMTRRSLTAMSS